MPKAIFIDKNIRSRQGHHLEYCLRAIHAFTRAGWNSAIVTNVKFNERIHGIRICPVIKYKAPGTHRRPAFFSWVQTFLKQCRIACVTLEFRIIYSSLGRFIAIPMDLLSGYKINLKNQRLTLAGSAFLFAVGIPVGGILGAVVVLPARVLYLVFRRVKQTRMGGLAVRILRLIPRMASRFSILPIEGLFQAAAIRSALIKLGTNENDVLVFSTFTLADLGVLLALVKPGAEKIPCKSWNVIFREPLFLKEIRQVQLTHEHRVLRMMLLKLAKTRATIRYWVDTPGLAEQYNLLSVASFGVLPIALPEELAGLATESAASDKPVCFGYIGDARQEKGYGLLPGMIERINRHGLAKPKPTFLIQSNFNMPNGNALTRSARLRLKFQDDLGVTVTDKMSNSVEYIAMLKRMDVVLLPYRHLSYRVGSSGILAEALAAGKPVVATESTWGGRQIRESGIHIRHVDHFIKRYALPSAGNMARDGLTFGDNVFGAGSFPEGITHVAIRAKYGMKAVEDVMCIEIEQFDATGKFLNRKTRYYCGRYGQATSLWPVNSKTACLKITPVRFDLELSEENCSLDLIPCCVPATESVPLGAIGVLTDDPQDLQLDIEDFALGVLELLKHFEHYRQTAVENSAAWRKQHDTDALIQALITGQSSLTDVGDSYPAQLTLLEGKTESQRQAADHDERMFLPDIQEAS